MKENKEHRLIKNCFGRVTEGNHYDLEKATKHQKTSGIFCMTVNDAVKEIIKFIDSEHVGCCLYYSIFLAAILEDFGIKSRFAAIPDDDEYGTRKNSHACVWFEHDGEEFIADPVKALDDEDGAIFCFIPLQEYMRTYLKDNEVLTIYCPLNAEINKTIFSDFLSDVDGTISL